MTVPVSVIIPARDAAKTIAGTLDGLQAQGAAEPFEVVVVDDGSRDGTGELAAAHPLAPRVERTPRVGPALARNEGVARASGRVLAFLDADCHPAPGWLAAGLAALRDADFVQGAVRVPPGADVGPFDRTLSVVHPTGLYESANVLVRREAFEAQGGFESWLRPEGGGKELGEDVWLGWRLRRAGARMAFSEEAVVHHAVFPRSARDYVAERRRLAHFPALVARVPELRAELCYRRLFLTRRTAAFDLAVAGVGLAVLSRRPAPLVGALPYAWTLAREARRRVGAGRTRVAAVDAAADAVGALALLRGSVAERTLLL